MPRVALAPLAVTMPSSIPLGFLTWLRSVRLTHRHGTPSAWNQRLVTGRVAQKMERRPDGKSRDYLEEKQR